jgi:hypothetical protein
MNASRRDSPHPPTCYARVMGGWGSGRRTGRPVKEDGLTIDLGLMLRKGWISDGRSGSGTLTWSNNHGWSASIGYSCTLTDPECASMTLDYRSRRGGGDWVSRKQHVRLVYTVPPYGGRRWWMACPVRGNRVGKLYLPDGGDIFAGRKAWGIAYRSQRAESRDRPFERLFAIQRRCGCPEGWEQPIRRPKGMWRRTFERLEQRYWELDAQCSAEMVTSLAILRGSARLK